MQVKTAQATSSNSMNHSHVFTIKMAKLVDQLPNGDLVISIPAVDMPIPEFRGLLTLQEFRENMGPAAADRVLYALEEAFAESTRWETIRSLME